MVICVTYFEVLSSIMLEKVLAYTEYKMGPAHDPCGTPKLISDFADKTLSILTS